MLPGPGDLIYWIFLLGTVVLAYILDKAGVSNGFITGFGIGLIGTMAYWLFLYIRSRRRK